MTPGWTRGLGDHTPMSVKKTGMSCHQDLTWAISTNDILTTSVQGALGGVLQEGVAMIHPLFMGQTCKVPVMGPLILLLTNWVQEVLRVMVQDVMTVGTHAGVDLQMSPHKEEALRNLMVSFQ